MKNTLYRPELLYSNGRFVANGGVLVSEDGQNSIVVSPGANGTLTPAMVCSRLADFSAGAVLLCQLESPFDAVEQALRFAKSRGMITILDPAPAHQDCLPWLPYVDYLTPNETEAAQLAGLASPIAPRIVARARCAWNLIGDRFGMKFQSSCTFCMCRSSSR